MNSILPLKTISRRGMMTQNTTSAGHTITRNVTRYFIMLVPVLMVLLASLKITNASPSDKWDENIRPIIITDYIKDKNAGKKFTYPENQFYEHKYVDFFMCPEYDLNFLFDHLNVILDDTFSSDICIPNFNITRQNLLFFC